MEANKHSTYKMVTGVDTENKATISSEYSQNLM